MPRRRLKRCEGGYTYRTYFKCPEFRRNPSKCPYQKCPWGYVYVRKPRIQTRWERQEKEIEKLVEKQIAGAELDEILSDGTVRYVKLVTVKEHKTHEGKYSQGRVQIATTQDLIGKKVGIIMLVQKEE